MKTSFFGSTQNSEAAGATGGSPPGPPSSVPLLQAAIPGHDLQIRAQIPYHLEGDQGEVEAMYRHALRLVEGLLESQELSVEVVVGDDNSQGRFNSAW